MLFCTFYGFTQDNKWSAVENTKKILFLDSQTNEVVSFVHISSKCIGNMGFVSDEKGRADLNISMCKKWTTNHLNYHSAVIYTDGYHQIDTIRLQPISYLIESMTIASQKTDNQYLYDYLNVILKKKRNDKLKIKTDYIFLLRSASNDIIREEINAKIKLQYSNSIGFENLSNSLVVGNFWYHPEAVFLNLNTDRLITSIAPFAKKTDVFALPFNASKLTKKLHKIKRLICDNCKETEFLVQISSINNDDQSIIKFDYKTLEILEYKIEKAIAPEINIQRINGDTTFVRNLSIKHTFDSETNEIELIQFQFDIHFSGLTDTVKIDGLFKNQHQDNIPKHFIFGKYMPDNLYEEICLSMPDTIELNQQIDKKEWYNWLPNKMLGTLSSFNPDVRNLFLNLPNSNNKFITNGSKMLTGSDYKSYFLPTEYWFYKYEKQIPNATNLNLNWVVKINENRNTDSTISSIPTLWNSNRTKFYSSFKDTTYFTLCANLIFDWMECRRLDIIDSMDGDTTNFRDPEKLKVIIDTSFNIANRRAQQLILAAMEDKFSFRQLVDLNRQVNERLGNDYLFSLFKLEIPVIISDRDYISLDRRYADIGYSSDSKDPEFFKYCMQRLILFYGELIKVYQEQEAKDIKLLGSFYGLLAESYMGLRQNEQACDCLRKYKLYWPEAYQTTHKKRAFYEENCNY